MRAEAARQGWQTMLTALFQMAFGLLLIFPLIRLKVLAPVGQLVGQAQGLAAGRLDQPFSWRRKDELGALEANLSDMATRLRTWFRGMQEESERVRAILRAMIEGVVVIARSGEVILMNRRAEEIFGLAAGPAYRGHHLVEMCRDPELQELLRATVASPDSTVREREISLAGAERRPWRRDLLTDVSGMIEHASRLLARAPFVGGPR